VRGSSAALALPAVAVVGTRRPSPAGLAVAAAFAAQISRSGFAVVSGLALGCDTAAHRACLAAGGTTVAVLPCGVDRVAPASNTQLAHHILNAAGCLASEYPDGTPPRNFRFVERNRVVAALARAVVVIECECESGTMHTARFALEQNKPLACCVPESGPASSGCRLLLEQHGAVPLRNQNDLKLFLNTLSRESRQP
jgi:DNA processing protein